MLELSGVVLVGLVLCGIVLLFVVGAGLITFLIKVGVIVRAAQQPPHIDASDYRLNQGRDVRGEDEQR